jgi:hypothetical protein
MFGIHTATIYVFYKNSKITPEENIIDSKLYKLKVLEVYVLYI